MNIIFSSCGNDSLALIQWAINYPLKDIHVAYSETQWGSAEWPARVQAVKAFCESKGIHFHIIQSVGFRDMCKAKRNQAFPRDGMQFCTEELKILPAKKWMSEVDTELEATCLVGVRREESSKRANWPEWVEESDKHDGRSLWSPLVRMTEEQRNILIAQTGFEVLPHRSRECFPCVNSGKMDLRALNQADVDKVAKLEKEMGVGKRSGKAKYMFRAAKCQGAEGIVEVIKWASHTKYNPAMDDMFGGGCDSGFCGD
jgi:hypothetical protein